MAIHQHTSCYNFLRPERWLFHYGSIFTQWLQEWLNQKSCAMKLINCDRTLPSAQEHISIQQGKRIKQKYTGNKLWLQPSQVHKTISIPQAGGKKKNIWTPGKRVREFFRLAIEASNMLKLAWAYHVVRGKNAGLALIGVILAANIVYYSFPAVSLGWCRWISPPLKNQRNSRSITMRLANRHRSGLNFWYSENSESVKSFLNCLRDRSFRASGWLVYQGEPASCLSNLNDKHLGGGRNIDGELTVPYSVRFSEFPL